MSECYVVEPIGWVESNLVDRSAAPKQGSEGAPDAWLVFKPEVAEGLKDIEVGAEILVLTWLHHADRSLLLVHPRDEASRPLTGVFSTRSSDRPNPIGLHPVRVLGVECLRFHVAHLEAVDETPIIDVKPVI